MSYAIKCTLVFSCKNKIISMEEREMKTKNIIKLEDIIEESMKSNIK